MKNNNIFLILLALISVGVFSCKPFEGSVVRATPDPIEVHADSIRYQISASVQPKSKFKKGGIYTGEAMIGSRSQKKVNISWDKYPKIKKTGVDTTVSVKKEYFDDMNGNDLIVKQSYERKGKQFELDDLTGLAKCCITTSRLVWVYPKYIFVNCTDNNYQKTVPINLDAKFNFPKDVSDLQEDQFTKADIKAIGDFISKKYNATKITIEGFASPEGLYKRNVDLSVNRSKQVQAWLTQQLKDGGYESYLDSTLFDIKVTHEDWAGFKASVNSLPYPADVKSQILEIISSGLGEDERERQIMALVGGKDKVENILAPLRRATIRVEGFEPRRTDAQIDQVAQDFIAGKLNGKIGDTFEKEEWMYAICRTDDRDGKKALLLAFREKYPSDYRAFNDLGAIYLMDGELKKGTEMLEAAEKMNTKNFAILNNLGVAKLLNGDKTGAKKSYEASIASKSTPQANYNLGVVLEKMGKYSQAVDKFNNASGQEGATYNAGLCKVLLNDLSGAKASLNDAIRSDKSFARAYYVMAVAGARASDASTMTVNLKKACELDGTMRDKAKKDLEFQKFWNSAEFKAATKG